MKSDTKSKTTRQTVTPSELVGAASAIAPLIAEHADAAERERRVPAPLVDALAAAGIFHMFVPRRFGGAEAEPAAGILALEELSKADGSSGWIAMIGATTGVVSAYLPEDVARDVYRPGVVTGGVVAPRGTAIATGEGYTVTGRWPFASGCEHSQWLICGCLVPASADDLERLPGGDPEVRMALFPACEVEIIDTWHVSGLRGKAATTSPSRTCLCRATTHTRSLVAGLCSPGRSTASR